MINGGIRDKNGCFTMIRDFDDLLRSWSKAQSEQEHQIALQERAKLASGGKIRSTIPLLNDGESVYVCHRLKSCPTHKDKLKEMLYLKFPKAENIQPFLSAFDNYGDKEHFFQVFQQLPEIDTVFDCNRFLNSRSKFYLKLD